jgi:hypothetical protein
VSDLTSNPNFPNNPSSQQTLTSSMEASRHGDNYGSTIRGFLIPPTTGSYTFWIASDDGERDAHQHERDACERRRAAPRVANARTSINGHANASQQSVALR